MEKAIIFIIIALVGSFLLFKNYYKIDMNFFGGDNEEYTPFGRGFMLTEIILGAVFGALMIYHNIASGEMPDAMLYYAIMTASMIILTAALQALLSYDRLGIALGKAFYQLVCCAIGFALGFAGSLIIFGIIVLWFIVTMFVKGASGMFEPPKTIRTTSGREMTQEVGDIYYDSASGKRYERTGSTLREMDD